jgi:hypothetical protein
LSIYYIIERVEQSVGGNMPNSKLRVADFTLTEEQFALYTSLSSMYPNGIPEEVREENGLLLSFHHLRKKDKMQGSRGGRGSSSSSSSAIASGYDEKKFAAEYEQHLRYNMYMRWCDYVVLIEMKDPGPFSSGFNLFRTNKKETAEKIMSSLGTKLQKVELGLEMNHLASIMRDRNMDVSLVEYDGSEVPSEDDPDWMKYAYSRRGFPRRPSEYSASWADYHFEEGSDEKLLALYMKAKMARFHITDKEDGKSVGKVGKIMDAKKNTGGNKRKSTAASLPFAPRRRREEEEEDDDDEMNE